MKAISWQLLKQIQFSNEDSSKMFHKSKCALRYFNSFGGVFEEHMGCLGTSGNIWDILRVSWEFQGIPFSSLSERCMGLFKGSRGYRCSCRGFQKNLYDYRRITRDLRGVTEGFRGFSKYFECVSRISAVTKGFMSLLNTFRRVPGI